MVGGPSGTVGANGLIQQMPNELLVARCAQIALAYSLLEARVVQDGSMPAESKGALPDGSAGVE